MHLLQHTRRRNGSAMLDRVRRARHPCRARRAGARRPASSADDGRPRGRGARRASADARSTAAATPSRRASRQERGQAGRRQQVGVLVRALPARVPLLPEPGQEAEGEVVFLGVNSNDNDGDAREFLAEYPVPLQAASRTRSSRSPPRSTACRPSPPPPSTTRRASSPTCTRADTRPRTKLAEDIDRYAR